MDLEKLPPAPWDEADWLGNFTLIPGVVEFIEKARLAIDVMMRRGWGVAKIGEDWTPEESGNGWQFWQRPQLFQNITCPVRGWPDPFTALVEADRWYKANVAKT